MHALLVQDALPLLDQEREQAGVAIKSRDFFMLPRSFR
jgi:hypothetical protein